MCPFCLKDCEKKLPMMLCALVNSSIEPYIKAFHHINEGIQHWPDDADVRYGRKSETRISA